MVECTCYSLTAWCPRGMSLDSSNWHFILEDPQMGWGLNAFRYTSWETTLTPHTSHLPPSEAPERAFSLALFAFVSRNPSHSCEQPLSALDDQDILDVHSCFSRSVRPRVGSSRNWQALRGLQRPLSARKTLAWKLPSLFHLLDATAARTHTTATTTLRYPISTMAIAW